MSSDPVSIDEVELLGTYEADLIGFHIDLPVAGARESFQSIPLLGWALGRNEPVARVAVIERRGEFFSVPVDIGATGHRSPLRSSGRRPQRLRG